jgi:hypothetical protein
MESGNVDDAREAKAKRQEGKKRRPQPSIPPQVRQWYVALCSPLHAAYLDFRKYFLLRRMLDTYANGEGELDRAEMHAQYRAFCESQSILPKDLANFGKIVKVP